MKVIHTFFNFFKKIRPRYLLSLDSQFYSATHEQMVYRFKVFGEHTFPKFTFDDIKNGRDILFDIHPADLMKITIQHHIDTQRKSLLIISEILRDNRYKLKNEDSNEILSGDQICGNLALIEKINPLDLYKIVYNTAFIHGRQLSKNISDDMAVMDYSSNVIPFQAIGAGEDARL